MSDPSVAIPDRGGAGDHLPHWLLYICGACTAVATVLSFISITLQLKNYRMPALQRCVVRIMLMVPLYACSSLIALYSLNAAFYIDAIRDLYEGFVIYTFLQLLITYLGGERDLLLRLRGRPPIPHTFPVNIFLPPMDPSDPWTLLNLKRGVLQYVQVKPILVVVTAICKATDTYHEGEFTATSGYTYVTIVYNISICLSLYCLAMFWVAVNKDLKPFRPVPKFLCVKGILFFSFWQGVVIGFLVSVGAITKVGVYTDPEHMTLAIVDSLICIEMPFFAVAHQYAFQASDYIDTSYVHVARLPFLYAFRDAFGFKDVWEDIKYTFKAQGVSYKAYEAADGDLHHRAGRQRRIRAGLRYAKGGKVKYWVPVPGDDSERGPLLPSNGNSVPAYTTMSPDDSDSDVSDAPSLDFHSASDGEDSLYARARRIGYTGFPNIDVSGENMARRRRREEDGILAGRWTREGDVSTTPGAGSDAVEVSGPSSGRERRSVRNQRRSDKGKGKAKLGVYGAWADRVAPIDYGAPPRVAEVEDAPFDGENENPGAWRSTADENGTALRWTTKRYGQRSPGPTRPVPPAIDSSLKPEPATDDRAPSPGVAVRSDAVDLVSEDALSPPISRRDSRGRDRPSFTSRDRDSPSFSQQRVSGNASQPPRRDPSPGPRLEPAAPTPPSVPPPQTQPPRPQTQQPQGQSTLFTLPDSSDSSPESSPDPTPRHSPTAPSFRSLGASSFRVPSYARWTNAEDNPWA